jgi:hypothetical protein
VGRKAFFLYPERKKISKNKQKIIATIRKKELKQ